MVARAPAAFEELIGSNRYATVLLGLRKTDFLSLSAGVNGGLSYAALERLSKETGVPVVELGRIIRVPERTLVRRKAAGRLMPDESDRLLRVSRVFALAIDLFQGDREAARRWLETPQRAFAGAAPFALATTDLGAREVEALIGRLEHGVAV